MKKKKEYIIVGSDNFWYASAISTLKEAKKQIKHIRRHIGEYGEPNGLNLRTNIPETLFIFEAYLIIKEVK